MATQLKVAMKLVETPSELKTGRTTFAGLRSTDWLWVLAITAGLRVFFFLSGFPFFGSVDEAHHVDLIQQYAGSLASQSRDQQLDVMGRWLVFYSSPEYTFSKENIPKGAPNYLLMDRVPPEQFQSALEESKRLLGTNHESGSPPVYYFLMACWLHVGSAIGVSGLHLLYWLRLPNVAAAMALVGLGFHFTQRWFPRWPQLPWGVAILLAAMPQDIFYAVNPDVLSAILFPLALHWILLYGAERKSLPAAFAGLLIAFLILVKLSNVAILAPMTLVTARVLFWPTPGRALFRDLVSSAILWVVPGISLSAWLIWNKTTLGDWTATAERFQILGWTEKPFSEMLDHPIFTPSGLGYFLSRLTNTFWQGELVWLTEWMHRPWMDFVYVSSSFLFIGVSVGYAAARCLKGRATDGPWGTIIATVASAFVWMAYLSLRFDFGPCFYPSRELPYFVSGRLIFGVAIPFAILYVGGLNLLWSKFFGAVSFLPVLVALAALSIVVELSMMRPVFTSQYNWYQLWP